MTVEKAIQEINQEIENFLIEQRLQLCFKIKNSELLDLIMDSKLIFGEVAGVKENVKIATLYFQGGTNERISIEYNINSRLFRVEFSNNSVIKWSLERRRDRLKINTLSYSSKINKEDVQAIVELISPLQNDITLIAKEIDMVTKTVSLEKVSTTMEKVLIESLKINSNGIPALQLSNGQTVEVPNILVNNLNTIRDVCLAKNFPE